MVGFNQFSKSERRKWNIYKEFDLVTLSESKAYIFWLGIKVYVIRKKITWYFDLLVRGLTWTSLFCLLKRVKEYDI